MKKRSIFFSENENVELFKKYNIQKCVCVCVCARKRACINNLHVIYFHSYSSDFSLFFKFILSLNNLISTLNVSERLQRKLTAWQPPLSGNVSLTSVYDCSLSSQKPRISFTRFSSWLNLLNILRVRCLPLVLTQKYRSLACVVILFYQAICYLKVPVIVRCEEIDVGCSLFGKIIRSIVCY